MKLYFTTRWGSPTDPDGPDGADTNYLIRASTPEEAAQVADVALHTFPVRSTPAGRPVQTFCHHITELGEDSSTDSSPSIVHGPWVSRAIIDAAGCRSWQRDSQDGAWVSVDELYVSKT